MSNGNGNGNGSFDWRKWLASQGVMAVFLATMATAVFYSLLLPMRDDAKANSKQLTDSISEANKQHANAAVVHAQAAVTYAQASRDAADHMRDTNAILREIREDQRNGVWLKAKPQ